MERDNQYRRDRSYGGYYGTSSDGGYTSDYDNQNRSVGKDGGREMGAGRSMRGNDYYRDADNDSRERGYSRSRNFGAHAYGDMSGGTRYGEGGSTYGGGSAYGHSDYGSQHRQDYDRNRESNRYRTGGSEDYIDYGSRNYGSFAGSREPDYSSRGHYNTGGRGHDRDSDYSSRDYGRDSSDRSRGYDRSFRGMPQGYGSTEYDERDLDRERSTYGNRSNYNPSWDRNNEERYR
ncbi:hypothetical protein H8S95_01265 [Pontibacter sp. KCTC 32443]|uniref:hypothetical protein n=1 Tax=Pontibacter TaxID=323449 RepID=UPI00164D1941|nr:MULTISPECIES: hypothetical protein [Pontibacter]MBC5772677.1 hypothetical protein [Pontibacter sp. KCTC 32443]